MITAISKKERFWFVSLKGTGFRHLALIKRLLSRENTSPLHRFLFFLQDKLALSTVA